MNQASRSTDHRRRPRQREATTAMSCRRLARAFCLATAVSLLAALASGLAHRSMLPTASAAPDPRPNIVVIALDDGRVSDLQALPNVRRLIGAAGTTFANSYATYPLCCPSRATWMTGQYAHNHGVMGNADAQAPLGGYAALDTASTIATWMRSAGYETGYVGKFLNKYGATRPVVVPPGWSDWRVEVGGGNYFQTRLVENGIQRQYDGPYKTDVFADKAVEIVNQRMPADAPLMLWVSFYAPHIGGPAEPDDPTIGTPAVAPRHRNAFAGTPLPTSSPAFNEADVSDKPSYVRNRGRLTATMQAQMTEAYQQRLESLLAVDEAVGRIFAAVTARNELANTVFVFTSDNGWMLGEHRYHAGKMVVYEASAKVPLLIRGPGVPAGVTRRQIVGNIDLAPTFTDLADTTPGLPVDGMSLLPLAADPANGAGRHLLLESGPRTVDGPLFYTAVRTPRWLYVEYHETGERELYDLSADPQQLVNQAGNPSLATTQRFLARRLATLRTCAGATCR